MVIKSQSLVNVVCEQPLIWFTCFGGQSFYEQNAYTIDKRLSLFDLIMYDKQLHTSIQSEIRISYRLTPLEITSAIAHWVKKTEKDMGELSWSIAAQLPKLPVYPSALPAALNVSARVGVNNRCRKSFAFCAQKICDDRDRLSHCSLRTISLESEHGKASYSAM